MYICSTVDQIYYIYRCTLGVTIILALNVYQLIINESMPKTNYLNPMQLFVITSVVMVSFTIIESIVVFIALCLVRRKQEEQGVNMALNIHNQGNRGDNEDVVIEGPQMSNGRLRQSNNRMHKSGVWHFFCSLGNNMPMYVNHWMDTICLLLCPIVYTVIVIFVFHWPFRD